MCNLKPFLCICSNGQVVPYSKGNITFNMLSPTYRPEYSNFYDTPALQEFVKAVRVRVRFQGHFYTRDPRHNYNALYSFGVTGRLVFLACVL